VVIQAETLISSAMAYNEDFALRELVSEFALNGELLAV
jgi:hypothetical protein